MYYTRLEGTREEKLASLVAIDGIAGLDWRECYSGWLEPFLPQGTGDYFSWPQLKNIFPWQHTGCEYKRTWPIAETKDLLRRRWDTLCRSPTTDRQALFKETRDRKVTGTYKRLPGKKAGATAIDKLSLGSEEPSIEAYGFRSLDRQWVIADTRVGDFIRPVLWAVSGKSQVFLTSLLTTVLGTGPAAMVTANVPDRHHFRGSYGGKDVIPLWRDRGAKTANLVSGFLARLERVLERRVSPEKLFAYVYGVLSCPGYVDRYSEELAEPGPRIPITRDPILFERTAELGTRLVFLHTYGERFVPKDKKPGEIPTGRARCTKAIAGTRDAYPEDFEYDEDQHILRVGEGEFEPVAPAIWKFSVSGFDVVSSWLGYRMKEPAGRSSSPLDEIRPERWTAQLTEELLRLLWVLEETLETLASLEANLAQVIESDLFKEDELPKPTDAERKAPDPEEAVAAQASLDL